MADPHGHLDNVMHESRLFPPPAEFSRQARIPSREVYEEMWKRAADDPVLFWSDLAREELHWFEPFHTGLEWNEPFAEWFVGGKTNACYNCVDKHVVEGRGDRTAIIWEGEPGEQRTLTYSGLLEQVSRFANALKSLGVAQGDRVSICAKCRHTSMPRSVARACSPAR
jgi:acetyl-CoA synthetase